MSLFKNFAKWMAIALVVAPLGCGKVDSNKNHSSEQPAPISQEELQKILESLYSARPINTEGKSAYRVDINRDNKKEILIVSDGSARGLYTSAYTFYLDQGNKLEEMSCFRTRVTASDKPILDFVDFNNDGTTDLIVRDAKGEHNIAFFYKDGKMHQLGN